MPKSSSWLPRSCAVLLVWYWTRTASVSRASSARHYDLTDEMQKTELPSRFCLNKSASDEIIWHCKFYAGCGVLKFYESGRG
mmetsp:Transcript_10283/g.27594  ORF Transcript_10283/g.27594 Transcript_10283/m.27594 type:complete len:82 (+) Transcript_10283:83-328(+)